MGSATTQALAATTTALGAASGVDLDVARELFAAARALGDSSQLSGALADSSAPVEARRQVVSAVFGRSVKPVTASLLTTVVEQRWSSASDLVDAIEELAVRAAAGAAESASAPLSCDESPTAWAAAKSSPATSRSMPDAASSAFVVVARA